MNTIKIISKPDQYKIEVISQKLAELHTRDVHFSGSDIPPEDPHFDEIQINNSVLRKSKWRHKRTAVVAKFVSSCLRELDVDINLKLMVNIHDKYDGEFTSYPVLVFGKSVERRPDLIQVPSLYIIDGTAKKRCIITRFMDRPYNLKMNKLCFFGASTGNLDTSKNQRIKAALWARNKQDINIKITNWIQGASDNLKFRGIEEVIPHITLQNHFHPLKRISIRRQLFYKYLLTIDGNSTSWDRFIWQLFSNSLVFKLELPVTEFWYPLLEDRKNYVSVNLDTLSEIFHHYKNNHHEAKSINRLSKILISKYILNPNFIKNYMKHLLILLSEKYSYTNSS